MARDRMDGAAACRFAVHRSAAAGLWAQDQAAAWVGRTGRDLLLAWRAPAALIAGPYDARLPHFGTASTSLETAGWPVLLRRSGGTACPVTPSTLQLAMVRRVTPSSTVDGAYAELVALLRRVLGDIGIAIEVGTVAAAFCPGRYDLSVGGRKLAGLSQRWSLHAGRRVVATLASLNVQEDPGVLADAVNHFYREAGGGPDCSPQRLTAVTYECGAGRRRRDDPWSELPYLLQQAWCVSASQPIARSA